MQDPEQDSAALGDLLSYLKASRGFDFSVYKRSTLARRLQKRMLAVGLDSFSEYGDFLQVHPDEFDQLFDIFLINVTSFFRDAEAWQYMAEQVIPRLISQKPPSEAIRIWSAGCSSGEEPYTIAMLFAEALGETPYRDRVKIYATDIDESALSTARQATYSPAALRNITPELRDKYWDVVNGNYSFKKEFRRNIIFGRHDLITDAPISRVDLLISRNTLMYFNAEAQERILLRLHFALREQGFLFLGKAETLLTHSELFAAEDLKARVFTKVPRALARERLAALSGPADEQTIARESVTSLLAPAFDASPVAHVVIDADGRVVLTNRAARDLFDLSTSTGQPLQDLAISYRPVELRSLIEEATTQRRPITRTDIFVMGADRRERWLDLQVIPFMGPRGQGTGVTILFTDVTLHHTLRADLDEAHHALETAYEELQSSNEELETTNEELQSTVEELETTNEELQATNEELETMNEELESTNEELETVNTELNERGGQLNEANSFLESILSSMPTCVIVLGADFTVRAWNAQADELWGVRAAEARGRNILALDLGLPVAQLTDAMQAAQQGTSQMRVVQATNRRGRAVSCRVRLEPLRGAGSQIEGILLLIDDMQGDAVE